MNGWIAGASWCWRCERDTRRRSRGHWVVCTGCKITCDYTGPTQPEES